MALPLQVKFIVEMNKARLMDYLMLWDLPYILTGELRTMIFGAGEHSVQMTVLSGYHMDATRNIVSVYLALPLNFERGFHGDRGSMTAWLHTCFEETDRARNGPKEE